MVSLLTSHMVMPRWEVTTSLQCGMLKEVHVGKGKECSLLAALLSLVCACRLETRCVLARV